MDLFLESFDLYIIAENNQRILNGWH